VKEQTQSRIKHFLLQIPESNENSAPDFSLRITYKQQKGVSCVMQGIKHRTKAKQHNRDNE